MNLIFSRWRYLLLCLLCISPCAWSQDASGLAQAFERDSLRGIAVPVHIINLGRPGTHPLAVEAAPLAQAIPGSTYATVAEAIHFSFLGLCRPDGRAMLAREGESDPICDDGGDRSRVAQALIRP